MKENEDVKKALRAISALFLIFLVFGIYILAMKYYPTQTRTIFDPIGFGILGLGIILFQYRKKESTRWYRNKSTMLAIALLASSFGGIYFLFFSGKELDISTIVIPVILLVIALFCFIYSLTLKSKN